MYRAPRSDYNMINSSSLSYHWKTHKILYFKMSLKTIEQYYRLPRTDRTIVLQNKLKILAINNFFIYRI